jgi:polysaccharide deacetylase family protein (PEP-CTERM system associated)
MNSQTLRKSSPPTALPTLAPQSAMSENGQFDARGPINAMSVDVEDYFQVLAFAGVIDSSSWDARESRVANNVMRIIDLFAAAHVKATFFTLGWVAERFPAVIRRIVAEGHELASHGYSHVLVTSQSPREFRDDVTKTKRILEDIGGVEVIGYRAATFSINSRNSWALDELKAAGYVYSSSMNPIRHDLYGAPDVPRFPFRLREAGVLEIPLTTVRWGGRNLPCSGGGFFRLAPYPLFRWGVRRVNRVDRQPAVFYFHPWELDPEQPTITQAPIKARFRHYLNLKRTEQRLRRLLTDFRWARMDEVFQVRFKELVPPPFSPHSAVT